IEVVFGVHDDKGNAFAGSTQRKVMTRSWRQAVHPLRPSRGDAAIIDRYLPDTGIRGGAAKEHHSLSIIAIDRVIAEDTGRDLLKILSPRAYRPQPARGGKQNSPIIGRPLR